MDLTEGSEQVDAGNLGVNSTDERRVTSEEERVDPGGLRFRLFNR